jgi:hypothetical protein
VQVCFFRGPVAQPTARALASTEHLPHLLGLALGAAPDAKAAQAVLRENIAKKAVHVDTGIIGLRHVFSALEAAGDQDTALAVLSQTDYPSLGFEFANELEKATTNLWELFDAPAEGTGMNSRNHHMFSSYSAYLVNSLAGLRQAPGSVGFRHVEMRPASARALAGADATLDLPSGPVSFRWTRSGGTQFDKVSENDTAELSCGPRGGVITAVEFASFGTPTTTDGARSLSDSSTSTTLAAQLQANPDCHAAESEAAVAARCVGKPRCSVPATRSFFGVGEPMRSQCLAAAKRRGGRWARWSDPLRLWAAVRCGRPEAIDVRASVPVGVRATVLLPLRSMRAPMLLDEARNQDLLRPAASRGQAPGVRGIRRVADQQVGDALAVELGSGEYELALLEKPAEMVEEFIQFI